MIDLTAQRAAEARERVLAGLRELVEATHHLVEDPEPFDGEITQEVPRVSA